MLGIHFVSGKLTGLLRIMTSGSLRPSNAQDAQPCCPLRRGHKVPTDLQSKDRYGSGNAGDATVHWCTSAPETVPQLSNEEPRTRIRVHWSSSHKIGRSVEKRLDTIPTLTLGTLTTTSPQVMRNGTPPDDTLQSIEMAGPSGIHDRTECYRLFGVALMYFLQSHSSL